MPYLSSDISDKPTHYLCFMTYQETLDYLYQRLPMFSRIGAAAYKKDLDNTLQLCSFLGNPEKKIKTIHIAGTNGKGSVSHMLAAIFQKAGYKTGLYTSPHLKDFRERIKINGEMVSEDFVVRFTEQIDLMINRISPSFFEITVAMAFQYFADNNVDIAVIETGLGGRLDSTNVILPEITVITNIGWDHMNLLGNSIESITFEKAGIIKKEVPVVIGETHPITKNIFQSKAKSENASITFADQVRYPADWHYEHHHLHLDIMERASGKLLHFKLDLPGYYQAKNLITVLEAVHQLQRKGWQIKDNAIHEGLENTRKITGLHGRWETIRLHPHVILDVAHNEAGMQQVVAQLELMQYKNLHIILGMVKDKEADKVLSILPQNAHYYFTRAQIPRAMPEEALEEKAKTFGLSGKKFKQVHEALDDALIHADKDDLILVCGSVFLVGEVDAGKISGH
jgi:dihydrofolate synthase/folylpolyglutamate synthase